MLFKGKAAAAAACAVLSASSVQAIYLNVNDAQSVRDVAAQIAGDLMRNYYINAPIQGIGQLPRPYYWWEAGATFGSLVTYSSYTGDPSLNDIVAYAILSQLSPTTDFMLASQRYDLGNDDQVIWALTAMEAAEHQFPIPFANQTDFAQNVWINAATNAYNDISQRWDTTTCNGGIRWQIYPENAGYTYKSAISNAGLFQLAARLARWTGDPDGKYNAFATKIYNWMTDVKMIIDDGAGGKFVFDGATTDSDCSTVDQHRWTYNAGSMFLGATYLASLSKTANTQWGLIAQDFFVGIQHTFLDNDAVENVMYELVCEQYGSCNTDQLAFKALMMRWFNKAQQVTEPGFIDAAIKWYTKNSAAAAAGQCSGGSTGTMCGTKWIGFGWDGTQGVGQQLSSLEAVQGILASTVTLATAKSPAVNGQTGKSKRGERTFSARDYMEMSTSQRRALQK